jgi:hypothetical protein
MADIFERLAQGRPPPTETAIKTHRKGADPILQGRQKTGAGADPKDLLMDVLANGPVPTTLVEERGATHGFNVNQLKHAKRRMGIVALKEKGKVGGRWFWALPKHAPAKKPNDHFARRLRNLSKMLGYRLQPIGKATE